MAFYLAIDVGNTRTKFGLFENRELIQQKILDNENLEKNQSLFNSYQISAAMLSSVNLKVDQKLNLANKAYPVFRLTVKTPLPFKIQYQSPETLGKDRIAAVAGSQAIFPKKSLLVIDAGTCVTYDYLDSSLGYLGGAISPGVQMRLKAMHTFTNQLPLINWSQEKPEIVGRTTITSMLSGAVNGIIAEMKGFIYSYQESKPELQIVITGGDYKLFEKELKNGIFADPNLVLKGLNEILIYNCE